jgi:2-polyprenyl-6-methoxyphenol hydroxylase-like FAD-dependent oxidoreductase
VSYDIVIVGGGLAGSTLAARLAPRGLRVLVLEQEREFRDRVRGEGLLPWGVNEARDLGIYDLLKGSCGWEVRYWTSHAWKRPPRDLVATTHRNAPCLTFFHPEMQEVMLGAAEAAGAEVRRGVTVKSAEPGRQPSVILETDRGTETHEARLVVGADGRTSRMRAWGGFEVIRDPECMIAAGVLLENLAVSHDSVHIFRRSQDGIGALMFPISENRMRTYYVYRKQGARRGLSGAAAMPKFFEACTDLGVSPEWFEKAAQVGPLAEFDGADTWIRHPYRNGLALIGDAASSNDPSWGNGLALAVRDARALSDALLSSDDWETAGRKYAEAHGEYFGSINRLTRWLTALMYEVGPEADARRERSLPKLAREPFRVPDYISLGPDSPSDETVRQRLFGET